MGDSFWVQWGNTSASFCHQVPHIWACYCKKGSDPDPNSLGAVRRLTGLRGSTGQSEYKPMMGPTHRAASGRTRPMHPQIHPCVCGQRSALASGPGVQIPQASSCSSGSSRGRVGVGRVCVGGWAWSTLPIGTAHSPSESDLGQVSDGHNFTPRSWPRRGLRRPPSHSTLGLWPRSDYWLGSG